MADKIYAKGLWVEKKTFDNGGEIIKLSIKVEDFCNFIEEYMNEKGYVKIDIKKKKEGDGFYSELNQYKPKNIVEFGEVDNEELSEDIPF